MLDSFGHEGRIPPLLGSTRAGTPGDYRLDPQALLAGMMLDGRDNQPGVLRLRRVFDTWSTDYSKVDIPALSPGLAPPFAPAVYPSYPPPYPTALRGIEIQIRVADPSGQHVKTLTIRQDFTKNL